MKLKFYKSGRGMGLDIYKPLDSDALWLRHFIAENEVRWTVQDGANAYNPPEGTMVEVLNQMNHGPAYIEMTTDPRGYAEKAYPFSWEKEEAPWTE